MVSKNLREKEKEREILMREDWKFVFCLRLLSILFWGTIHKQTGADRCIRLRRVLLKDVVNDKLFHAFLPSKNYIE
jgi:hypothetical protein